MVSSQFNSIMEKPGDKHTKTNSQQSDLYNYNLDHVYCSDNSRYRNAGTTHLNITSAASDLKSLRKENKQLQAMLLLHLDLIQEQSNQLIAKDKQLIQLREENAQLRLKCENRAPAAVTVATATTTAAAAMANERRPNINNTNNNRHSINSAATIAIASTASIANVTSVSHRMLNTSAGSANIDSYFTTSSNDPKVSTVRTHHQQQQQQQHENVNTNFKTINNMNSVSNVLLNNNNSSNNSSASGQIIVNENNSQTIYPTIKVEANSVPTDELGHVKRPTQVLNSIGPLVKDNRYKVVASTLNKSNTIGTMMRHDKTVKYRAIENNVIGHNNGKIISKIILQRKKSENGEKIFVRTKNIEIGSSNNRVNYGKWSPLRTIKSEVIDTEPMIDVEPESEPVLLQNDMAETETATTIQASPNLSTAAVNDDETSSDVPNIDDALTPTSMSQTPPQQPTISSASSSSSSSNHTVDSTFVEQSDASECQIDSIKIEQEIDDILDESDVNIDDVNCMSFGHLDVNNDEKLDDIQAEQPSVEHSAYGDDEEEDEDDEDDENEVDIDDEEEVDNQNNDTLDYSQDTSNQDIESPRASDKYNNSESMQCIPSSSSPVTSIVSTSDYTHCDFGGTHFDSNSSTQTGGGGIGGGSASGVGSSGSGASGSGGVAGGGTTILYPIAKRHINRNAFLTTRKPYNIREWLLDEMELELKQEITDEICKEENEANLELPKWRTWEMSSNRESPVPREYEDLSDDAFVRRHARFLLDERKRKKWDVQRIREQRTIERLKRRHCKDELNQEKDMNKIFTFYPTLDQLKTIQITDDLPVSAFGEPIPLLPSAEFSLPWHSNANSSGAATLDQAGSTATTTTLTNTSTHDPQTMVPSDHTSSARPHSTCSLALDPPSNVSSILFLQKRRPGRTRTSISHNQQHPNVKCIT